nr:MAG TPA: Nucleotide modification associated domain 1 [Caudoviricetes sp.]
MTKINEKTMREQYDGQYSTFCKKNSDYGNSFEESLDKHGIVASIVRMGDKMNRLEAITDDSRTQQVGSESLLDTLEDLSNYAALTACWLKGVRAENGETSSQKVAKFIFGDTECTKNPEDGKEEEVCHVYVLGQDEPYMTLTKKKEHPHGDDCPDMIDAIKYNVQDAKETVEFRATLDKPFKPLVRKVVHLPEPKEYILKMLDNINRIVQMKLEKDELIVLMDISDDAGLIAKAIVQSGTRSESISIIKDYLFDHSKNIPFEIREWIYGVIVYHFYYINKEHQRNDDNELNRLKEEIISNSMDAIIELMVDDIKRQRNPKVKLDERQRIVNQREKYYQKIARFILNAPNIKFEDFKRYFNTHADLHNCERELIIDGVSDELVSQIDKELEKFKEQFIETLESNANCISIKHAVEVRLISQAMNGIMAVLVPNILAQRNPKYDLDTKLTQANQRNEWYKEIANLILRSPELSFDGFSGYVDTFAELMPDEKQLIKEGVATEIYSQTDKNPGGDEESEFRSKKFHIPDETLEDLKEPEEEPERKRTVLGMIFPFWL